MRFRRERSKAAASDRVADFELGKGVNLRPTTLRAVHSHKSLIPALQGFRPPPHPFTTLRRGVAAAARLVLGSSLESPPSTTAYSDTVTSDGLLSLDGRKFESQ